MTTLNIGFIGTKEVMSPKQHGAFVDMLQFLKKNGDTVLHHGCGGEADRQAHGSALSTGVRIETYPPPHTNKKEWCQYAQVVHPVPLHQTRPRGIVDSLDSNQNQRIVDATEWIIVAPDEFVEQEKSAIWVAVRYALKVGKDARVIFPDGSFRDIYPV